MESPAACRGPLPEAGESAAITKGPDTSFISQVLVWFPLTVHRLKGWKPILSEGPAAEVAVSLPVIKDSSKLCYYYKYSIREMLTLQGICSVFKPFALEEDGRMAMFKSTLFNTNSLVFLILAEVLHMYFLSVVRCCVFCWFSLVSGHHLGFVFLSSFPLATVLIPSTCCWESSKQPQQNSLSAEQYKGIYSIFLRLNKKYWVSEPDDKLFAF